MFTSCVQTVLQELLHMLEISFAVHHSLTALSITRWSSLFHSSAIRRHSSLTSLMLSCKPVLAVRLQNVVAGLGSDRGCWWQKLMEWSMAYLLLILLSATRKYWRECDVTIFTDCLKFIEVKVSHIQSHFSAEHFDISIIKIGPRGKIILKKYKGVPILWNTVAH